jgi:arsenate reductase
MAVIQIFGTKKCKDTGKALRFFKERGVPIQFIDLKEKAVSPGELSSISRSVDLDDLIDRDGRQYEKRNLGYMKYNLEQELLDDPLLFRTPIVRMGPKASVGHDPAVWKSFRRGG